jgi:uncharacterized membrane protein YfcA
MAEALQLDPRSVAVLAVAAIVHGTVGFGSGPLLAPPVVGVVRDPTTAISALLIAAIVLAACVAVSERSASPPARRLLAPIWGGAVLGSVAGTVTLQRLDRDELQALVAAVIIAAAVAAFAHRPFARS